jgi:hypothetical protein
MEGARVTTRCCFYQEMENLYYQKGAVETTKELQCPSKFKPIEGLN